MRFLSLFRKAAPEDVYEEIAQKIVYSSFRYRATLEGGNDQQSADAGAEVLYFLINMVYRTVSHMVDPARLNEVMDEVIMRAIGLYVEFVLRPSTPQHVVNSLVRRMLSTLIERDALYSQLTVMGEESNTGFHAGTAVFALSYYIHRAMGLTDRDDVDDILWGKRRVQESDLDAFPKWDDTVKIGNYVMSIAIELKINDSLKQLR